ncbi:VanW family protein [Paenibacillus tuaregi]|uniref:VanW family protein n=1 Tax=Paenibacillus tuaregi TaxID=1816681 RepID=UPI0008388C80|nr:VanW family protein [Paenibacillus tuaregi]
MKKLHILLIIAASLLLFTAVTYGILHLYAARNKIPAGVTVGGVDIGGLTYEEGQARLEQEFDRAENEEIYFHIPEVPGHPGIKVQSSWRRAGVHYTADNWEVAVRELREGSIWSRARARLQLSKQWQLTVHWDKTALHKTFNPAWEAKQFGEGVNAQRIIGHDDSIRYVPEVPVTRIDWQAFAQAFKSRIPLSASESPQRQSPVLIQIPLKSAKPAVTLDTLRSQGIQRKITEFTTGLATSSSGRAHNINAAAQVIDGMLLAPGDIFDYGKVIDTAEAKYGFKPAPVIIQGKFVPGIGGGICQVSSTLYNAAVRAGLDIVERRNHSLPVSYLPKGQDATFAKGYINFRFKNTTSHHILIKAGLIQRNLTVKLFGDIPTGTRYELESRTIKVLPAQPKYVRNNTLALGIQEVVQEGKEGYIVETYRVKYVNGTAVERRKISRDTYPPQNSIIAINMPAQKRPSTENKIPKNSPVEDGVQGPSFP